MQKVFHFDAPREPYRCDAAIVWCFDNRFELGFRKFLKRIGVICSDPIKYHSLELGENLLAVIGAQGPAAEKMRSDYTAQKKKYEGQKDELQEKARAKRVRHLPVLDGGKLVGLVSQRDLHLVETLKDVDPTAVLVEEAMSEAPYTVGPGTPLAKVAETMVRRRYGSAVIVDRGRVVGMFTTVDALRALSTVAAPAKRARRKAVAK